MTHAVATRWRRGGDAVATRWRRGGDAVTHAVAKKGRRCGIGSCEIPASQARGDLQVGSTRPTKAAILHKSLRSAVRTPPQTPRSMGHLSPLIVRGVAPGFRPRVPSFFFVTPSFKRQNTGGETVLPRHVQQLFDLEGQRAAQLLGIKVQLESSFKEPLGHAGWVLRPQGRLVDGAELCDEPLAVCVCVCVPISALCWLSGPRALPAHPAIVAEKRRSEFASPPCCFYALRAGVRDFFTLGGCTETRIV